MTIITGSSFMLCTSAGSISHSPRTSYLSQDRLVRPSQCAIVCQGTGRAMDTSDSELQTLMSRESSVKCRGTVRPPKCTLVFRRKDLCCDLLRLNQIFCSFVLLESSVARSLILDMGSDILIFFFRIKHFFLHRCYLRSEYLNPANGVTID